MLIDCILLYDKATFALSYKQYVLRINRGMIVFVVQTLCLTIRQQSSCRTEYVYYDETMIVLLYGPLVCTIRAIASYRKINDLIGVPEIMISIIIMLFYWGYC